MIIMEILKIKARSACGLILLVIGMLFIVLPGPAILFIPLGLLLLSYEYESAKHWLKKYQRFSRKAAVSADKYWAKVKQRRL